MEEQSSCQLGFNERADKSKAVAGASTGDGNRVRHKEVAMMT